MEAAAVNTLETTSYFQGKRTVNDYLDQFCDMTLDTWIPRQSWSSSVAVWIAESWQH